MGRRITNYSERAKRKREQMRATRESRKVRPASFNPQPLAKALAIWSKQ